MPLLFTLAPPGQHDAAGDEQQVAQDAEATPQLGGLARFLRFGRSRRRRDRTRHGRRNEPMGNGRSGGGRVPTEARATGRGGRRECVSHAHLSRSGARPVHDWRDLGRLAHLQLRLRLGSASLAHVPSRCIPLFRSRTNEILPGAIPPLPPLHGYSYWSFDVLTGGDDGSTHCPS